MVKKEFYLLFSFLLAVLVFLPVKATSAQTLSDIPENYKAEVNYLIERGIVAGYENGEFRPERFLTREETATMIGKALGLNGGTPRKTVFPDVSQTSFAAGYIQSANDQKVLMGYTDGTFKPLNNMTRLEMAYLLTSAFKLSSNQDVYYVDMPSGKGASQVIKNVTNAGITDGYSDGTYRPNNDITRIEFAVMLARALNPEFKIQPPEYTPVKMYVTENDLNIRKGPGTQFGVLGKLQKGDEITSYSIEGDWVQIKTNNVTGYVHKAYVSTEKVSVGRVITIDPGHGGSDPGAVGNGLKEKDIVLSVGLYLKDYLQAAGIKVVMTRSTDVFISLDERVKIAERAGSDTFVSLHMNAATSTSASGTETYSSTTGSSYKVQSSKKLSEFIQERLLDTLGTKDRGEKTAEYKVLKTNSLPSVLVEMGFISNANDAKLVSTHPKETAEAIYLGILDYYKWLEK